MKIETNTNESDLDDNNDYSQKLEKFMASHEKQLEPRKPMSDGIKASVALLKLLHQTNSPKYLHDSILSWMKANKVLMTHDSLSNREAVIKHLDDRYQLHNIILSRSSVNFHPI